VSGTWKTEKLYFEMLNHYQNESSVEEYATVMCRYFMQLRIQQRSKWNISSKIYVSESRKVPLLVIPGVSQMPMMDVAREAENM
jgi:hypothetical protein